MPVDRHGEDEAVVVVGMLADEVDSAWRDGSCSGRAAPERLFKLVPRALKETWTDHLSGAQGSGLKAQDVGQETKTGKAAKAFPVYFTT
jgi:hypothetical protein